MDNYKKIILPLLGSIIGSAVWYNLSSSKVIGLCEVENKNIYFKDEKKCYSNLIGASLFSGIGTLLTLKYLNKN